MNGNISKLRKSLVKDNLNILLISSPANITYLTKFANFYGGEREAFLIISNNSQFILTDGRYSEAVKKEVKNFKLLEISHKSPAKKLLKDLMSKYRVKKVGVEGDDLTYAEYQKFSELFEIVDVNLHDFRAIKTTNELDSISKACRLGDEAFKYILKKIKLGVTEKKLAFEMEFFIRKNGGEISFPPFIAFGENAAIPHHKSGETRLNQKNGQFVLLDFGTKVDGYCSDMTRTVFFGKASYKQKDIYEVVKQSQQKAVDYISKQLSVNKRIKAAEVDKIAREYITEKGYPTIPHSLGHGIGLEVHEHPRLSPKSKDNLTEGMVFSIEPGIYLPGFGGVRIEDLFVIDHGKLRQLTSSSKALIEI